MNVYSINKEFNDLLEIEGETINQLTGEVYSETQLAELRQAIISQTESFGKWLKNKGYLIESMKAAKKDLDERIKIEKEKFERAKNFGAELLKQRYDGKFNSASIQLSLRKSESIEITNEDLIPKKYFKKTITYEPIKDDIKAAINSGIKIKGAKIVQKDNLQIK